MRIYLLASHKYLAAGVKSSVEFIMGPQKNIHVLNSFTTDDFDLASEVNKAIQKYENNELIVITDLFGGSVNNQFMAALSNHQFHLISGLNLTLVMELLSNENKTVDDAIAKAIQSSQRFIINCNNVEINNKEDDF